MKVKNIKWDSDGDMELLKQLSTEMEISEDMIDKEEISDYLSGETEFCHDGFVCVN